MKIEKLTDENVLFQLERNNFSDFYSLSGCTEELTSNVKHYFVAKIDETVVGYMGVLIINDEAELLRIAVNKEHRNNKIGEKMINYLSDYLKKQNVSKLFLEVSNKNEVAISFYKKLGFKQINTRKNYYLDGGDAIIMLRSE